jgi:hypothetical protein
MVMMAFRLFLIKIPERGAIAGKDITTHSIICHPEFSGLAL